MKKEQVKKFDLEAAFKALDEIEIPVAEKGIRANRVDLKERFSQKPAYETLVEDYYDISDNEALEEAQEDREGEVAKAKLSRIEKIVDLDAETADDLLQSYVGRYIIQCPQCMTLFYKKPEDIEYSEENPDVVNINEICQHCGNSSGYTLVGKVDAVKEDEAANYEPAEEENELDLDFDTEVAEEEPAEEEDNEEAGEEELDLDLNLEEIPEEGEEKKEESFQASGETVLNETIETESLNKSGEAPSDFETENGSENLTLNEEATDESLNKSEEAPSENASENTSEETTLNEEVDKDLDAKLKAHNDYIAYLQQMIKQEEEALKKADNEEIKAAIQRRLDGFNADLEEALPDALKSVPEVAVDELADSEPAKEPAAEEEAPAEEPVEEALTEETNECKVILSDSGKEVFSGSKEDCEKIIEKNKDTETAKEHGLEIKEPAVEESLNVSEEAPSEEESENKSENTTLNESVELNEGADEETKLADFEAELPEPEQQVNEAAEPTTAKEVEDSLSNFINDLDKPEEAPVEESLNESNDVEAALAEFVRNLPLDGMSENLQEANKADNFNVSDKEFDELINSDVFNEDLPSSSVVDAIVDRIKNAGNDVEENLEECSVKEECENGECKEDEPIKAEGAPIEEAKDSPIKVSKDVLAELIQYKIWGNPIGDKVIDDADIGWSGNYNYVVSNENSTTNGYILTVKDKNNHQIFGVGPKDLDTILDKLDDKTFKNSYLFNNIAGYNYEVGALITESLEEAAEESVKVSKDELAELIQYKIWGNPIGDVVQDEADLGFNDNLHYVISSNGDSDGYILNVTTKEGQFRSKSGPTDLDSILKELAGKTFKYPEGFSELAVKLDNGFTVTESLKEEAEEEAEEGKAEEEAEEEAQPIETTVEEVKEIATEVATEVAAPVEDEEAAEEQQEEIKEIVDEVVEEKLGEEKPEEDEAEEADEEEVEFDEDDIEDIQEESFNTHVKDFLTEVYENVSDFAATNCELKEGKLFVEGKISFKSGKEKLTMFEFLPAFGEGKLFFEGFNKDFSEDKAFTLNCSLTEAKELITESFGYKYKINETLVEGLK